MNTVTPKSEGFTNVIMDAALAVWAGHLRMQW
uniref:Uncharacterized protein n=1 Tax=Anguilla anguilla TaxID=7936 RepID=A0A0E9SMJ7_ANGAN